MQPFSRETIVDRRQPTVRWTAVIAGALVAGGVWLLLQLIFTGGALSAIDPDEVDRAHAFGIGTSLGSVLAPLIALFAGGLVAGRLAGYYDRKLAGFHGVLVWTLASIVGVTLLAFAVGSMASSHMTAAHGESLAAPPPGAAEMVDESLASVNAKLKAQGAPSIDKGALLDASRASIATSAAGGATFDRDSFVRRLDDKTALSRPEAEAALTNLGDRAGDVALAASQIAAHREKAMGAAEDAGNAMLGAGVGLLLCLAAAIGGAIIGSKRGRRNGGVVEDTAPRHTTAPYATVATPEAPGNEL